MEFVQRRQYCEEEEEEEEEEKHMKLRDTRKRPFHFSPLSSTAPSPSSPTSHYKGIVVHSHVPIGLSLGNSGEGEGGGSGEREHMFDKVVTPSDVGKLNRLVIPKQHAEKYFPLDSTVNEKGLLLNFEDRNGKPWRFRYSYWNSSQSYVMTKGWSRFVKDKKLDAGDMVSFERGIGELGKDRLYIDWKRRPDSRPNSSSLPPLTLPYPLSLHRSVPWNRLFFPPNFSTSMPRTHLHLQQLNYEDQCRNYVGSGAYGYDDVNPSGPLFYLQQVGVPLPQGVGDGNMVSPMVFDAVPVVHNKAAGKRLRLFGVNLDCPTSTAEENDVGNTVRIPQAKTIPPSPPPSPLQLRLFNGTPVLTAPSELSRKGKQSLSLDLAI